MFGDVYKPFESRQIKIPAQLLRPGRHVPCVDGSMPLPKHFDKLNAFAKARGPSGAGAHNLHCSWHQYEDKGRWQVKTVQMVWDAVGLSLRWGVEWMVMSRARWNWPSETDFSHEFVSEEDSPGKRRKCQRILQKCCSERVSGKRCNLFPYPPAV